MSTDGSLEDNEERVIGGSVLVEDFPQFHEGHLAGSPAGQAADASSSGGPGQVGDPVAWFKGDKRRPTEHKYNWATMTHEKALEYDASRALCGPQRPNLRHALPR